MPDIPVSSPLGYIGVFLLILGIFLILAGFNIIKIQQVTVASGKKTYVFGIIFTLVGLLSVGLETSGFSKNPPVSATNTSTIANSATTPAEILENAKSWSLVYSNSFDSYDGKWTIGEYEDTGESGKWSISNSKYLWGMKAKKDDTIRANYPAVSPIDNFYLSVDVKLINGSPDTTKYGLIFRGSGYSFYIFRLVSGTSFRVRVFDGDNRVELIDPTPHSAIQLRAVNNLAVIGNGSHFIFFINDQFVGETYDSRFPSGNVGLANTIQNAGDEILLEIDNFELRSKP